MALTKNDIVAKVNDLGFTKKKSIETVESLLEIVKGTSKMETIYWYPVLGNSA